MEAEEDLSIPSANEARWNLVDLLNIALVRDKILFYLDPNLQDLKLLSEVSKGTLKVVRESQVYSDKATLVIGKDTVENDFDLVKVLCSESSIWEGKKLRIDAAIPVEAFRALLEMEALLGKMESISFYIKRWPKSEPEAQEGIANLFTQVLEKAESLKDLGLEPIILTNCVQNEISNEKVPFNLKNLRTLKIQSFQSREAANQFRFENNVGSVQMSKALEVLERPNLGLENLKKLVFGRVHVNFLRDDKPHQVPDWKGLMGIIDKNKETLEDIELHEDWNVDIWKMKKIGDIHIPNLKRLVIPIPEVDTVGGAIAQLFLANQGQLEHLDISFEEEFPLEIIRIIEEKQAKLKSLRIKAKHFATYRRGQMNWTFLRKLTDLKAVSIIKLFGNNAPGNEDIVGCLPVTTKRIELRGFKSFFAFWRTTTLFKEKNIWMHVSHLKNLTELDLDGCRDALNDDGLQDLIKYCPQLTLLSFSHCYDVTNFGVTGVDSNGEKSGVSLDQLTSLKSLSIESCRGIDTDELLSVVKFNYLQRFAYDGRLIGSDWLAPEDAPEMKDVISRLLCQNPHLQELSLCLPYMDETDYAKLEKLEGRFVKIKRVHGEAPVQDDYDESDTSSMWSSIDEDDDDYYEEYD